MTLWQRKIVVTGGTGTLGRAVVARLLETKVAGDEIAVISRRSAPDTAVPHTWLRADYATGQGLEAALDGASVVIHRLNDQRGVGADRSLLEAVRRAPGVHPINILLLSVSTRSTWPTTGAK